jgi:hypothetical protein
MRAAIPAQNNSAILIDTDKVFHGVERVAGGLPDLPLIGQQTRLHFCGKDKWKLRESEEVLADFIWSQIRYSISWKAYCFIDDQAETLWREGLDDLSTSDILDTLEAALRERGLLKGAPPSPTELALLLVDTFVRYPSVRN